MAKTRRMALGRPAGVALGAGLLLAGGCHAAPASAPLPAALASSPVALQCERTADGVLRVSARNRTGRAEDVDLIGLAYAGQGTWEHWWTQPSVDLAPHGAWSALFYIQRIERIEARDRSGRLLADFDVSKLPDHHWGTVTALDRRADWQPFGRAELFGQQGINLGMGRQVTWRTLPPAALPRCWADLEFVRPRVIGGVRSDDFTPEQLDELRGRVAIGRTLIVCGGADLGRLRGWARAGLLAAPVRGVRRLPGLVSLARRYGVPPVVGPIAVADLGRLAPPARVALEEGGVPLVVERPLGSGTLFFVTFDPARPPFRGSASARASSASHSGPSASNGSGRASSSTSYPVAITARIIARPRWDAQAGERPGVCVKALRAPRRGSGRVAGGRRSVTRHRVDPHPMRQKV